MNKITKSIITISALSLFLVGCDKDAGKSDTKVKKVTTIEEIQAEKGKPARVVKASIAKLTDVRKYSGSIEGFQQTKATSKLGDPLAYIYVQVGSVVQKDQVLAEYIFTGDNTSYQQVQEQVALLEKSTARMREVFQKGGLSQQDLDKAEMELKIAKMNLETSRRATKILAPAAGVVTALDFQPGQTPGVGTEFCTIAKLEQVILKVNVTSRDIGFFKKGSSAVINLNGVTHQGHVTLVPLAANPVTRFFPVEITFDNPDNSLLPGMFVTAELDAREVEGVVIPREAVVYRNGVNAVWVVDKDGKGKRKIVQLGVQTKDDIQIKDGIEAGETVIVEGQSRINDGDKVLIVK